MTNPKALDGIKLDAPRKMLTVLDLEPCEQWAVIRANASTLEIHTQSHVYDSLAEAETAVRASRTVGKWVILHQVLERVATYEVTASVEEVK